jgi:hypothetical protein
MSEPKSADRLREMLAAHDPSLRAFSGDVLYNVQAEVIYRLLGVVDEVADRHTAELITDAIYERMIADADKASERMRQARRALAALSPLGPLGPSIWERGLLNPEGT